MDELMREFIMSWLVMMGKDWVREESLEPHRNKYNETMLVYALDRGVIVCKQAGISLKARYRITDAGLNFIGGI